ncbi:MAG: respiratory nitrate reductase subunit gamma [Chloroflexi bacterium]|nr:respiratory nitrate reductase subunit gamma [Chloroflexota bacterium]
MDTVTALWSMTAGLLIGLCYLVGFTFIVAFVYRIYLYAATPAPLPIPTTPAPRTIPGSALRVAGDVVLFQNLLKYDKPLWIGAWLFHVGLLLILLRHLRYFVYPIPNWIIDLQTLGVYAGFLFPLPALYLLWRRFAFKRVLYVSGVPDLGVLILLAAIAGSGILMKYAAHVYLVDVKAFVVGLLTFQPVAPPAHPVFIVHLMLVLALMLYFPFSKLMHAGGIFFSPTRYQPYRTLERRYVNPWNLTKDEG